MPTIKKLSIIITFAITFGLGAVQAFGATDGKVQRCEAKLHTCFQTGDLNEVFPFNPQFEFECNEACNAKMVSNSNACDLAECTSRCSVAFGIQAPPCE